MEYKDYREHVIDELSQKGPAINQTEIAQQYGITRAAVQAYITKLLGMNMRSYFARELETIRSMPGWDCVYCGKPAQDRYCDNHCRFMHHVVIEKDSGCWTWCGLLMFERYPVLQINGHRKHARRLMYEYYKGVKISDEDIIVPICGNKKCVNPDHCQINVLADCFVDRRKRHHLSPSEVEFIGQNMDKLSVKEIAKILNITYSTAATRIRGLRKNPLYGT